MAEVAVVSVVKMVAFVPASSDPMEISVAPPPSTQTTTAAANNSTREAADVVGHFVVEGPRDQDEALINNIRIDQRKKKEVEC